MPDREHDDEGFDPHGDRRRRVRARLTMGEPPTDQAAAAVEDLAVRMLAALEEGLDLPARSEVSVSPLMFDAAASAAEEGYAAQARCGE